jgi:hypothetical protein
VVAARSLTKKLFEEFASLGRKQRLARKYATTHDVLR